MIDRSRLDKVDSFGMCKVYDKWPEIAESSFNMDYEPIEYDKIDHIVFAGMGGSGSLSDVFSAILSKSNIHVSVVKGYHLPKTVNSDTLVVTTTVSGNTTETLSVLNSATKQNCKVIGFTSGNKMEEYCTKNKIECRKIEQIHSPRSSFPAFLYSMLNTLKPILPIEKSDVLESISHLKNQHAKISSENLSDTNPAISLAEWIVGIPVIYYPWGLKAAAIRFKNSFQENAKSHAMAEDVIEACHNGIVAWEKKTNVQPVLIRGQDDFVKTVERWKILKSFFEKNEIEYKEIVSVQGSIVSKIINLIYLLDFTTIYHSILNGTDPSPVSSIDFIKNHLS